MPLVYRLLADFVVIVHFAYVAFVLLGLLAVLLGWLLKWEWVRNRWFRSIHLVMILVVVLESWLGFTCPLTDWEDHFRALAGETTHQGAFIADCVHDLMFYDAEPWVFTICYTLFGAMVLVSLLFVPPRWRNVARSSELSRH